MISNRSAAFLATWVARANAQAARSRESNEQIEQSRPLAKVNGSWLLGSGSLQWLFALALCIGSLHCLSLPGSVPGGGADAWYSYLAKVVCTYIPAVAVTDISFSLFFPLCFPPLLSSPVFRGRKIPTYPKASKTISESSFAPPASSLTAPATSLFAVSVSVQMPSVA